MKITVIDFLKDDEPVVIEGDTLEVENKLRKLFHSLTFIPHGDLYDLVQTISRMHGVALRVDGVIPPPKRKSQPQSQPRLDPWLRENDDLE